MNVFDLFAKISLDSSEYTSGVSKVVSGAKSLTKTVGVAVTAAVTAATTATVAFAKSSVDAGMDFDKSMSQVAATMGTAVDAIQDLRDFAQEMGRTTAFSATQAADALNYMALAGYDADTSMSMLPNVLNLAAAGGMELARASDMITDSQTALGLSLDETSVLVDQMAKTASTSNTSVSQLGDAILTIGSTARYMSGGTTELNSVLGILADNSIKASEAGTHLRNIILSLSSPSKEGEAALKALGISIFDANGNMREMQNIFVDFDSVINNTTPRITELYEELKKGGKTAAEAEMAFLNLGIEARRFDEDGNLLEGYRDLNDVLGELNDGALKQSTQVGILSNVFNARDVAAAKSLMGTSVERWEELGNAIDNAAGAADKMAKTQLDNLAGDITLFQSALEGAKIAVSDELTPSLRKFVQFGTDGLSKVTAAFQEGGLTGAMGAFGEVLSDGLTELVKSLPEFIDAGMSLLGAVGQGIVDNLDTILDAGGQIIDKIITAITDENNLSSFLKTTLKIVTAIGDAILTNLPALLDAGLELIVQLGQYLVDNASDIAPALLDFVKNIGQLIIDNLPELLSTASELILTLATGLADSLPELIPTIVDIILQIVETLTDPENIGNLVDAAIALLLGLADGLIDSLPVLLDKAPEIIENLVTALVDNIPKLIDAAIEIIFALTDALCDPENILLLIKAAIQITIAITKGLLSLVAKIPEIILKIITKIVESFGKGFNKLKNVGKDIIDKVKEGFLEKFEAAKNWGKDLIGNFVGGITEAWDKLKSGVTNIANGIKDFLGFSEPKKGPLSNFHTYAPDMMELFAKGIRDNEDVVTDQLEKSFDFGGFMSIGGDNTGTAYGRSQGIVLNLNIDKFENNSDKDIDELADTLLEALETKINRREGVFA